MKQEEFLTELEDILQKEDSCKVEDNIEDYDEWDSLSKMALMAFYDKQFGIKISLSQLSELKTVSDLIELAGENIK